MRISDWSSDVCSSDLLNWLAPLRGLAFYGSAGYADAYYVHYPDAPACAVTSQCPRTNADGTTQNLSGRPLANAPRWTAAAVPSFTTLLPGGALATFEIGRASSRERVCQYVWISLGAVPLQKNNTKSV